MARFMLWVGGMSRTDCREPEQGCIVVVEQGADWPACASRGMAEYAQVAIVPEVCSESGLTLSERVARKVAAQALAGVVLSTAVLVCGPDVPDRHSSRVEAACALARLLAHGPESSLVLAAACSREGRTHELVSLAGTVLEAHPGRALCVRVWAYPEPMGVRAGAAVSASDRVGRRQRPVRINAGRFPRRDGIVGTAVA